MVRPGHVHVIPQFTPAQPRRPGDQRNTRAELVEMAAKLCAARPVD